MATFDDWGPRPGGPDVRSPAPPARRRTGRLLVSASLLGVVGLSALQSSPGAGLLFLCGATACLFTVFGRPALEHRAAVNRQHQHLVEAEAWRARTPEVLATRAADPLEAVKALTSRDSGGVFLGITPDYREWITTEREQAVLVLGPPRSGKTSSLIVPTILARHGPVVSTSTKLDVLEATAASRSRDGRVWLFDPSGTERTPAGVLELHWTPVQSCSHWDGARAMADAMVDASPAGVGVENAAYWSESAKTLLAPLMHAASLAGLTITDVRRWVTRMWLEDAGRILEEFGAASAADDLSAIAGTEERERSSIFSTTRIVLSAYGSDAASARSQRQNFDAGRFVNSNDTVYVTAPSHLQNILAPLVAGLLEEIRLATYANARGQARGASRPAVLWALDEVANIAPIRKLPAIVSEAGGQGLQVMACFQDLSQAKSRWGSAADGFLTLFGTKVVFPGIGDKLTLEALSTLVGDWDRPYQAFNTNTGRSSQFGVPIGASFGSNSSSGLTYSARREALLTPAEIANIPPGHALSIRSQRWGLVETTPFFSAQPWRAVLASAPPGILFHGGEDQLALVPALRARPAPAPGPEGDKWDSGRRDVGDQ